jgi:diguanylate cyclase (GGDEF)-like protein
MTGVAGEERAIFLTNLPAGRGERLFAYAVIAASGMVFLMMAPFAKLPLPALPAFIAIYQSSLVVNDVITVAFLLSHRQFARSDALSLLAAGYLFTALMSVVHALTFPGLFAPTGLLGAGMQTTAWLYMFWHGGFPLFVLAYASVRANEGPARRAVLVLGAGSAFALVCGFAFAATRGQRFLPSIMQGDHHAPILSVTVLAVLMLNLSALAMLMRRRPCSLLDLWLIVTMCAWLFDIALSTGLNGGRYDLGFYAGRIYGLLAASFILIVLLVQNGKLHVQLVALQRSDRGKAEQLRRLTVLDPLTGIANRRAFEEALGQEWRRMMRHRTALSLLMIDVDYFKRFNDSYGHVAGDQCLRAVAQALAQRARRAGEMVARYGGEEFAVLLPHAEIEAARHLAELMCETVREQRIANEGSAAAPYVTISVGVASIAELPNFAAALAREGAADATLPCGAMVLVEIADQALYAAKLAGRNRVAAAAVDKADTAGEKRQAFVR